MHEVVPASMLPLDHIAVTVQLRNDTVNASQAAEEGIALPYFRCLLTEGFRQPVETLSRTHDNTPIFPILRDNFQHFRGEILALVTAKPILHFINTGNHALNTVFVANQETPVIQLCVLAT